MRIDIWSDLICPWCWIGKRRFEQALISFPQRDQIEVVHHSLQLDPAMPTDRVVRQTDMLVATYGMTLAQARASQLALERTAATVGLEYHLADRVVGNTAGAHQLVQLAGDRGVQDAVVERLYRAHFTQQRSLFDHECLIGLAGEAGLDPDEAHRVLAEGTYADALDADARQARALGATGVPFFVIDNRYGVSGAQPPEIFIEALSHAWADTHPAEERAEEAMTHPA
ncbi:DsbA family oxidoreductase [Frankia sp. CiP3]|uniref:DsbA family oxidoreductase n=1 Tax=Frankia sp. CiP3 TaxID=2880971 RepID=UPI001EF602F5|nr:DsbA family oxidoreductase [Frankia sp. CiP3]